MFILLFTLKLSANVYSQDTRLNVVLNNVELETVFNEIRSNSDFTFIYNVDDVSNNMDISLYMQDATIKDILDKSLEKTALIYSLDDKVIIIKKNLNKFINKINQEKRELKGSITDKDGNPIPGASVVIKGTNIGVVSDIDGLFTISVNKNTKIILEISCIGMKTQMIAVTKLDHYNVVLNEDTTSLEDVIVTGFQTISKERATGSFNIVSTEQLDKATDNISSRLVGVVSGINSSTDASGNTKFEIRGKTSLYANASPLIVVDGFPIEGDFESINPNNVESISVLKDAGAASIWGARSANGVIVITTKNAKKNTPLKVSLNAFTRVSEIMDLDYVNPIASSKDQIAYEKLAYNNWGAMKPVGSYKHTKNYTLGLLAMYNNEHGMLSDAQLDTRLAQLSGIDYKDDVYKHLLRRPVYQQYNLTISGSTEKTNSFVSLMFEDSKSQYVGSNNKSYQLDSKIDFKISDRIDFTIGSMLQLHNNTYNGVTLSEIKNLSPYERLLNKDGSYTSIVKDYFLPLFDDMPMDKFPYSDWSYNPLREMRSRDLTSRDLNSRIFSSLRVKILPSLSLVSKLQFELFSTNYRDLYSEDSYLVRNEINSKTEWDKSNNTVGRTHIPKGDFLDESSNEVSSYNFRNQLNYSKLFKEYHQLNMIAGIEVRSRKYTSHSNPRAYGYNDETLSTGFFPNGVGGSGDLALYDWLGNSAYMDINNSYSYKVDKFFSMYGNLAYTYDDKYSLSASIRTDASNIITNDPKYRYSPFWSTGLSWNIDKEDFMSSIEILDVLSIRLTYGINGNIDNSTSFKPLLSLNSTPGRYTNQNYANISSNGNPLLRWEKTRTINLGIDYSMFSGKLYGKVDFYRKHGFDLMANVDLNSANGTSSEKFNNAEILNTGFDLEVGSTQRILGNDIVWNGNLTYSYNYNEILKLLVSNYSVFSVIDGNYIEGEDASTAWAYQYNGVNGDEPTIIGQEGTVINFSERLPEIHDGRKFCKKVGVTKAPHYVGLSNNFKIYDFDLSFIATAKFGHVFRRSGFNYPVVWSHKFQPNKHISEIFNGDKSVPPLPVDPNYIRYYKWGDYSSKLDYLWESASHIRIQEICLSYRLPKLLLNKMKINSAKIYVQANNLGVIAFNKYNMDPEYPEGNIKPSTSVLLGVKLDF